MRIKPINIAGERSNRIDASTSLRGDTRIGSFNVTLPARNVSLAVWFNPRKENDMTKTTPARYALEFKQEAVRLVQAGQSQASVARTLFLDTQHRLIEYAGMFRGTIDGASVYPREVVKEALRLNAAAVILSHNHPSGNPAPSGADKVLTQRLKDALTLVDVRTLDHIVVTRTNTVSFAERGLI